MNRNGKVLDSINNDSGDRCIDIFERETGSFGYEEYRRDPEDAGRWFPLNRYSRLIFESREQAQEAARATVPWLTRPRPR